MTGTTPQPAAEKRRRSSLAADLIVGVTNGVSNVPDAMANALLAGVSPIVGLYALLAGTPAAALTTSSQFMTVTVTAAMAVTVGSGLAAVPAGQRDAAVATLAIMVGVFMAIFGLLRGGRLLRFVSNAVMKGFLNGVALLVIVGQLANITGFDATRSTKLEKAVETALNVTEWDVTTLAVGLVTVALILAAEADPAQELRDAHRAGGRDCRRLLPQHRRPARQERVRDPVRAADAEAAGPGAGSGSGGTRTLGRAHRARAGGRYQQGVHRTPTAPTRTPRAT